MDGFNDDGFAHERMFRRFVVCCLWFVVLRMQLVYDLPGRLIFFEAIALCANGWDTDDTVIAALCSTWLLTAGWLKGKLFLDLHGGFFAARRWATVADDGYHPIDPLHPKNPSADRRAGIQYLTVDS